MLKTKKDQLYFSNLFLKFINTLIFCNLKLKIETWIYNCFFYWKRQLNSIPLFYFFESLLKVRPLIGFYIYAIKKKNKKRLKIKPYFMRYPARWQKAIYWLSRSVKIEKEKLFFNLINELYCIVFLEKSNTLRQKMKYYKTILLFKTSKNFKW